MLVNNTCLMADMTATAWDYLWPQTKMCQPQTVEMLFLMLFGPLQFARQNQVLDAINSNTNNITPIVKPS